MIYLWAWVLIGVLAFIGVLVFNQKRRLMFRGYPVAYRVMFAGMSIVVWPALIFYVLKDKNDKN